MRQVGRRSASERQRLFAVAEVSCREMREWIAGERKLTAAQVETKKQFIRDASAESFYFFAKIVLGFDKLTNQTHKKWADELQAKWLQVNRYMRLKPRGTYKTTLYGIAFLLWVWACWSPEIRFFYTSANQTLLDEVAAELDRFIGEKSEHIYAAVFGIRRNPTLQNTAAVFNIVGKAESKGSSLMFRTAGGSTNGVHPHFIIVDDPMDKQDRESEATRGAKTRWFNSLTPLLVPHKMTLSNGENIEIKKMMFIATRWHMKDLVHYVLKKNAKAWDFEVEGVYGEDGKPRYPELLPESAIAEIKSEIDDVFFACQYLNNPLPEGQQLFSIARLHKVRPDQYDVTKGTNYCFFDPAKGKKDGDWPAVVWLNWFNGRGVFFDAIADSDNKMQLEAILPLIAAKNKEMRVRLMRFESNGGMGLASEVKRAHKDIGYSHITIEEVHEDRNKVERINAMQPSIYRGNYLFRSDWEQAYPELMNQLVYFPVWDHDDFPDVIEKAVSWTTAKMPDIDRVKTLGRA